MKWQNSRYLSFTEQKTLWESRKMLVTIIFSFSHNVFIVCCLRVVKTCENFGLIGLAYLRTYYKAIWLLMKVSLTSFSSMAEPNSSVGSVADLRRGGRWFDPWLGQYSIRGLMIVIATGFIPLSPLSVVSTMGMWESSKWLGNNIVRNISKKNSRKAWIVALAAAI